jgi:hypothetical protein
MRGAIPPLPQYVFMAWCSVKAQGQLYLTLPFFFFVAEGSKKAELLRNTWGRKITDDMERF